MVYYKTDIRQTFDTIYLKVELFDNSHLETVMYLLTHLQTVNRVNITKNRRTDLTIYPSKFFDVKETKKEVELQLDHFFSGRPLDPVFIEEKLSGISATAYGQIIEEINNFGKNLEKYPDLHSKFDEEGFRNYFLPHLNSISKKHTATGETFNKIGKSDILIQDGIGTNVFIAECKIWHGESELKEAIDQLVDRYVNWRDESTALVIFNKNNKDFSKVIESAKRAVLSHPLCVRELQVREVTSISYLFKNSEDNSKTIKLELILFNVSTKPS